MWCFDVLFDMIMKDRLFVYYRLWLWSSEDGLHIACCTEWTQHCTLLLTSHCTLHWTLDCTLDCTLHCMLQHYNVLHCTLQHYVLHYMCTASCTAHGGKMCCTALCTACCTARCGIMFCAALVHICCTNKSIKNATTTCSHIFLQQHTENVTPAMWKDKKLDGCRLGNSGIVLGFENSTD